MPLEEPRFIENLEKEPMVETVRAAILYREKFLLLQKNEQSKNPLAVEFPGGKIFDTKEDQHKHANEAERLNALLKEIKEETNLEITPEKHRIEFVEEFETFHKDENGQPVKRRVYLYLIRIPDTETLNIQIGETKDRFGVSEDNHKKYEMLNPRDLINTVTELEFNPATNKNTYSLSRNSRHIKKLLSVVGFKI